jgi:hypothetical protein
LSVPTQITIGQEGGSRFGPYSLRHLSIAHVHNRVISRPFRRYMKTQNTQVFRHTKDLIKQYGVAQTDSEHDASSSSTTHTTVLSFTCTKATEERERQLWTFDSLIDLRPIVSVHDSQI